MEALKRAGFTDLTLKIVNRCRIYLRVSTLSDIASGDGSKLNQSVFNQTPFLRDHYNCPVQGKPPQKDWKVWNYVIKHCFQPSRSLHPQLGHWTVASDDYKHDWDFFITATDTLVWQYKGDWLYFDRIRNDRGRFGKYDASKPRRKSKAPPRGMIWRTTVIRDRSLWITQGKDYNVQTNLFLNDTEEPDWDKMPDAKWICNHLQVEENVIMLQEQLQEEGLIAVSDGSFDRENKIGTAAWIISSLDEEIGMSGGGIVPGNPNDNSAF